MNKLRKYFFVMLSMLIVLSFNYMCVFAKETISLKEVSGLSDDTYNEKVPEETRTANYQIFEDNFKSANDYLRYNFSLDFSKMDSAAVCLVRKGYVGARIKVFDEKGNQILQKEVGYRHAKNWGFIDKPSADATICNYTITVTPISYQNKASNFRIIVGDKKDTELMMSGKDNAVLLDEYCESKVNLENNQYVPNVGEYWFKFTKSTRSVITVLSNVYNIHFKVLKASNLFPEYDSSLDNKSHKTSFLGNGPWKCAEKSDLTDIIDFDEYYLVVYSENPQNGLFLKTGTMATAVGNPVMSPGNITISPNIHMKINNSRYTPLYFNFNQITYLPNTAQAIDVNLEDVRLSYVDSWKIKTPDKPYWFTSPPTGYQKIDMNFVKDSLNNVSLNGTWCASIKASSSYKNLTITPSFYISYYYEFGD
ncbi:hypothetical protein SAMN05216249_11438 [Acetitomaculum ruminis DSM 5522]|uniref:Uncharacterized protein n=1 Tax=Acetitomaculum ruminis DSM 5522 TaxID=1120918 RepID=A0A1I0ZBW0_9FIRM|nr:hypothetical protein [Acetitomaculum ruminis]SFB23105.1 hypothetical protein SAMN05216249_11438 [Acetitomaculum ruminis DSM 5522]